MRGSEKLGNVDMCYGITPTLEGVSANDFSYVFRTKDEAEKFGDVVCMGISNESSPYCLLYMLEYATSNPGRVCAETMWRLLGGEFGNRLLHDPRRGQFSEVYMRGDGGSGIFEYRRGSGGYALVNAALPKVEPITRGIQSVCPDLQEIHVLKLNPAVNGLYKRILDANRNGCQIDPEAVFQELLENR